MEKTTVIIATAVAAVVVTAVTGSIMYFKKRKSKAETVVNVTVVEDNLDFDAAAAI